MPYARVVTVDDDQWIALPEDMRLSAEELDIRREGDAVVLTPVPAGGKRLDVDEIQRVLKRIPDDVFEAVEEARRQDRGRKP